MPPLNPDLRKPFEKAILDAREAAEAACRATLVVLAVQSDKPHPSMTEEERSLRRALRAKERQLGGFEQLVSDCAYEQWHRMLFARFLAENGLLMHPSGVAVSLDECAELADEEGEPDAWMLAARYAQHMLPGIFRNEDPSHRLRLAPEGRHALEQILAGIPQEVFTADDALGWVYQFWQTKAKKEVNDSERKIGGADLAPVTQLFTENYMVRFLLENSLGAWWAARHPQSPLVKKFDYLRFTEDGSPAAGEFEGWQDRAAEVTVMDPCMGSGHFLVVAFEMLRRMRMEEEGLSEAEAGDAVLRDNLFGLELDPRCTQLGAFALAFAAWKAGGYRPLPLPNVACSGIGVAGQIDEWRELAKDDEKLIRALERLHALFLHAPTLGSLIDPRKTAESGDMFATDYADVAPVLERALEPEGTDPAAAVFGGAAAGVARAADLLSREYALVVTNPPFLPRTKFDRVLLEIGDTQFTTSKNELATMMLDRARSMTLRGGSFSLVSPQTWLYLVRPTAFRKELLRRSAWRLLARLGLNAFESIKSGYVDVFLGVWVNVLPDDSTVATLDVSDLDKISEKRRGIVQSDVSFLDQSRQIENPDARFIWTEQADLVLVAAFADSHQGIKTSDNPRFARSFWELDSIHGGWKLTQRSPDRQDVDCSGFDQTIFWEDGNGRITEVCQKGATFRGKAAWNRQGIAFAEMGYRYVSRYIGSIFDGTAVVVTPKDPDDLPALWSFFHSAEFWAALHEVNPKLSISTSNVVKVPIDMDRWRDLAKRAAPLAQVRSPDPTQWIFKGHPTGSERPLQVAIARLLRYQWPEQPEEVGLEESADPDGIVCLPAVRTEKPGAERLRALLAKAYGDEFSPALVDRLLETEGAKKNNLDAWLREEFFAAHCKLFHNRPFIWHIWDGRKDGFSALVNYHRLDRAMLEKLTYTYLGWWITAQKADIQKGATGAEPRLAAALALQRKLKLIGEGEPPYDIYVRWKPLAEQPIGWDPDLNDGVRLNVRPFVRAGILRRKFSVNWKKDRGKDPDGSERINDRHYTRAKKMAARESRGA